MRPSSHRLLLFHFLLGIFQLSGFFIRKEEGGEDCSPPPTCYWIERPFGSFSGTMVPPFEAFRYA